MNLIDKAILKMIQRKFSHWFELERSLTKVPNSYVSYGAQAGHPLGGLVLYPPLTVAAGLGWMGRHGLLITPRFDPGKE